MTDLEKSPLAVKSEIDGREESSAPARFVKGVFDATKKRLIPSGKVEGPDYKPSGILAADAAAKGLTAATRYSEPSDRCDPPVKANQRLYTFENHDDIQNTIRLESKSFFTMGNAKNSDIKVNESSVSDLHGVLQYRKVGDSVKLYLMDLDAPSGISINGTRAPAAKYVELLNQDVIKLGSSETEFIFIDGNA